MLLFYFGYELRALPTNQQPYRNNAEYGLMEGKPHAGWGEERIVRSGSSLNTTWRLTVHVDYAKPMLS